MILYGLLITLARCDSVWKMGYFHTCKPDLGNGAGGKQTMVCVKEQLGAHGDDGTHQGFLEKQTR